MALVRPESWEGGKKGCVEILIVVDQVIVTNVHIDITKQLWLGITLLYLQTVTYWCWTS